MLSTVDHFLLHGIVQLYKVRAVTCDADYQIPVCCRIFSRINQGLSVYHIELHMLPSIGQIGADQGRQFLHVTLGL